MSKKLSGVPLNTGQKVLRIDIKSKSFPQELLGFTDVEELYLLGECEDFPVDSPFWHNLKTLSIKFPKFKGDLSSLFKLRKLENLKIIETPIESFRLPLGHVAAPLIFLTIKGCGLKKIPEEISMLATVREINLSDNELQNIPIGFLELKNLKRLNLDHNLFEVFPDHIKKMQSLGYLSIDKNNFSEEELNRIQREFNISPN